MEAIKASDFRPGDVLVGFGLANAGRYATVIQVKGKRIRIQRHLDGKDFWTFPTYWRLSSDCIMEQIAEADADSEGGAR